MLCKYFLAFHIELYCINISLFSRCGRCESIGDLWIAGLFDPSKITCSELALKETERLTKEANLAIEFSLFAKNYTFVTFLNARSLRKHQKDIANDPELMNSAILGIAETHLHVNEEVGLDGFEGSFVNAGKGKGVAAFTKIVVQNITKINQPSFSAISLELENLRIVFCYMSSDINMEEVNNHLRPVLLEKKKPTLIIGDMNFHFSKKGGFINMWTSLGRGGFQKVSNLML